MEKTIIEVGKEKQEMQDKMSEMLQQFADAHNLRVADIYIINIDLAGGTRYKIKIDFKL